MYFDSSILGQVRYLHGKEVVLTGYIDSSQKGKFYQALVSMSEQMVNEINLSTSASSWEMQARSKFSKNSKSTMKFIEYLNDKPNEFSIGINSMVKQSGIARTTVIARLQDLESFGLLEIKSGKPGLTNIYVKVTK